jgi:hypothetical protein
MMHFWWKCVSILLDELLTKQITEADYHGVLIKDFTTKNSIPEFLYTLIQSVHVDHTHACQGHNQTVPAALCWPLTLQTKNRRVLIIAFVNEREIIIHEVGYLGPWQELAWRIAKFILEVILVHDGGVVSSPTRRQEIRHTFLTPGACKGKSFTPATVVIMVTQCPATSVPKRDLRMDEIAAIA